MTNCRRLMCPHYFICALRSDLSRGHVKTCLILAKKYVKCYGFYAILILQWVDILPIVVWLIRHGFKFNIKMFKFSVYLASTFWCEILRIIILKICWSWSIKIMLTFLGQGNGFKNHVQLSKPRSENCYGFWSKIGSEFVELSSTSHPPRTLQ